MRLCLDPYPAELACHFSVGYYNWTTPLNTLTRCIVSFHGTLNVKKSADLSALKESSQNDGDERTIIKCTLDQGSAHSLTIEDETTFYPHHPYSMPNLVCVGDYAKFKGTHVVFQQEKPDKFIGNLHYNSSQYRAEKYSTLSMNCCGMLNLVGNQSFIQLHCCTFRNMAIPIIVNSGDCSTGTFSNEHTFCYVNQQYKHEMQEIQKGWPDYLKTYPIRLLGSYHAAGFQTSTVTVLGRQDYVPHNSDTEKSEDFLLIDPDKFIVNNQLVKKDTLNKCFEKGTAVWENWTEQTSTLIETTAFCTGAVQISVFGHISGNANLLLYIDGSLTEPTPTTAASFNCVDGISGWVPISLCTCRNLYGNHTFRVILQCRRGSCQANGVKICAFGASLVS